MDNTLDVMYIERMDSSRLVKEVLIESDTDICKDIQITKFSDRPHHVFVECLDDSDYNSICVELHKGSFVRGMYKVIKEFDQLDYFKELMEEDV